MTQEEKFLLLQDLCARLPYGVKVLCTADSSNEICELDSIMTSRKHKDKIFVALTLPDDSIMTGIETVKPYLRSMSNMTQKEIDEYDAELDKDMDILIYGATDEDKHITSDRKHTFSKKFVVHFGNDWLDKNMFDYRGLISIGLAIEAPEGMYKEKE